MADAAGRLRKSADDETSGLAVEAYDVVAVGEAADIDGVVTCVDAGGENALACDGEDLQLAGGVGGDVDVGVGGVGCHAPGVGGFDCHNLNSGGFEHGHVHVGGDRFLVEFVAGGGDGGFALRYACYFAVGIDRSDVFIAGGELCGCCLVVARLDVPFELAGAVDRYFRIRP